MKLVVLGALVALPVAAQPPMNLLLNAEFGFHSFDNSRSGRAASFESGAVPGWSQDAYGDVRVVRSARVTAFRPRFLTDGVVNLHPGKRLYQLCLLAETGLDPGDLVSLSVHGWQPAAGAFKATVHLVRVDSAEGEWSPKDYGQADARTFPKHSRGELIWTAGRSATAEQAGAFEVKVEGLEIQGGFTEDAKRSTAEPNVIGLAVELSNVSADQEVWVYGPCLARGGTALGRLPAARALPTYYRSIPRTIAKLWRGEPLHLLAMGSSIDRGSANPPQYLYDEDPSSPTYKQPLAGGNFDGSLVGHPEWTAYYGWWQHWFMATGRLRRALMQRFDYPIDRLLLNVMACDGSSISESHSGLAEYASLSLAPEPNLNGHAAGMTWPELYPALFERAGGTGPDLVIFGSGANEKIDGADETACFEGAIRWFQRHYPNVEFLFCMFQNRESYTPNTGGLAELALRYGIPYLDFGRSLNLTTRYANSYALVPADGHPQAAGHELWFRQLEQAFYVADPIEAGLPQRYLPERANPYTLGWEGELTTYAAGDPRLRGGTGFVFDDTVVNLWAGSADEVVGIRVDGEEHRGARRRPMTRRDLRNSTFAIGRLRLGDRHIVEVTGTEAKLVAVDAKTVLGREWVGVDNPRWTREDLVPETFASDWGAPYGNHMIVLSAGDTIWLDVAGTDLSVAWVDRADGGTLRVDVDGALRLEQLTNQPFVDAAGTTLYMENRRGILDLPYGLHRVSLTAVDKPVAVLGVFAYDTRPNRDHERVVRGWAMPGETIRFTPAFAARPLVSCGGGLRVEPAKVECEAVTFGGDGPGTYEATGE